MKPKRLTFKLHLFGREIFSLSFEWISSNLGEGYELATPLHLGKLSGKEKSLRNLILNNASEGKTQLTSVVYSISLLQLCERTLIAVVE